MSSLSRITAMVSLTLRESVARKTFITFVSISTLVHIFMLFVLNFDMLDAGMAMVKIMGQEVGGTRGIDLKTVVLMIQKGITIAVFTGGIILSIFATAGLVPQMLEKGYIDLLLSKPLYRWQLFLSRFIGAILIIACNVAYLIGGTWLILGAKTGIWHFQSLLVIPMVVLAFAMLFASMSLIGVLSRSASVTVMISFSLIFLSPLLQHHDMIYSLLTSKVYYFILEGVYHLLPKVSEISQITEALVSGKPVESWSAVWTSALSSLAILAGATFIFQRKDY